MNSYTYASTGEVETRNVYVQLCIYFTHKKGYNQMRNLQCKKELIEGRKTEKGNHIFISSMYCVIHHLYDCSFLSRLFDPTTGALYTVSMSCMREREICDRGGAQTKGPFCFAFSAIALRSAASRMDVRILRKRIPTPHARGSASWFFLAPCSTGKCSGLQNRTLPLSFLEGLLTFIVSSRP